jgi:hypothetical protein
VEAEEHAEGEEVTDEFQLDDLGFDWTEGVPITDEVIQWAMAMDYPSNVSGIDYSRAVSHDPGGGDRIV